MIVEQRTYTLKPLRCGDFLELYERAALPLQKKYLGRLVGFFVSEIGPLNQVVHLWAFDSLRAASRATCWVRVTLPLSNGLGVIRCPPLVTS